MSAEWWVMRIVMDDAARDPDEVSDLAGAIDRGDLQVVNGDVVEPIDVFEGKHAQERAVVFAERETRRTGAPHKVVLSADL